jgi:hypothetical protein
VDPLALRDVTVLGVRTTFVSDPVRREAAIADMAALATRGVTSLRVRVNWAMIAPTEGRIDARSLDELAEFVGRIASTGIEVWPTLCGNRLPGWFLNEGAFADAKATERFWPRYVDALAGAIGDVASGWVPFETPVALLHEGWRVGTRDPEITDEAKFADAFGGVVRSLAATARLLGGARVDCGLDVAHAGATNEVITVFRDALLRGRLEIPGRIARDIAGLEHGFAGMALSFPDQTALTSGDAMRRWRDTVVKQVYSVAEGFSPLDVSILGLPDTATDAQHSDLFDAVRSLVAETRDGGAQLRNVWLGDTSSVAGLVAALPDGQALDL